MLEHGDQAPDFTLLDQEGEQFDLGKSRGHKVLVYFYP
jgi:peroxiredoxin Q/BCP